MFKLNFNPQNKSLGKAPGNIDDLVDETKSADLLLYNYNQNSADLVRDVSFKDILSVNFDNQVQWISFTGKLSRVQVDFLKNDLKLDPLTVEDILLENHRPKLEELEEYIFCVLRIPIIIDNDLLTQQFSLVLKNNVLVSFIDTNDNVFDDIKKRIMNSQSKLRSKKEDYLFYLLLDAVVSKYFYALNFLNNKYEKAMEEIETSFEVDDFKYIQNLKHEILNLRRNVSAIKDLIYKLSRDESNIIQPDSYLNIRDLMDQAHHANESAEMLREMIMSLIDLNHNKISNRMNEIMKVLTIISTIFIPITFVAGVYGMNFVNMPELHSQYGYPITVFVMALIVLAMLIYFKKMKWF
jgi:magnesium transporter